ncbi:MAG: EpsG family protein [Burkholderiaceae bacterium]|nr:EpsG family protein [Burkholderiaceae bacterium]
MIVYWLMFLLPALAALAPVKLDTRASDVTWAATGIVLIVLIGFRHEVGGDWGPYLQYYELARDEQLVEVLKRGDPGYHVLNWVGAQLGLGIYFVNTLVATILVVATISFCRTQPLPWLAMTIAVPYLLIVVGMGYSRQAAAIGLVMLAYIALQAGAVWRAASFIVLATSFHISAIATAPLLLLAGSRIVVVIVLCTLVGLAAFVAASTGQMEQWAVQYVALSMESEGAWIRITMNGLAAAVVLAFRRRLLAARERNLWAALAIVAIASFPFVSLASTAVDRIALYLLPLQIVAFGRLHRILPTPVLRTSATIAAILCYGAVLMVWLSWAIHAHAWLPYQFARMG